MISRGAFSANGGLRFRQRQRGVPSLNTAALPDLIFTVLFFFMIVTTMRQVEPQVRHDVPQGQELNRLGRKSSVVYIYIGTPVPRLQPALGTGTCIQLNDKIATPDDIAAFIQSERQRMSPEDARRLTVCIRADRNTEMGVIADVKMALRRAKATRIVYSATSNDPTPKKPH